MVISPEFQTGDAVAHHGEETLKQLAAQTGGDAITEISRLFEGRGKSESFIPLAPWLAMALLALLLLQIADERFGIEGNVRSAFLRWKGNLAKRNAIAGEKIRIKSDITGTKIPDSKPLRAKAPRPTKQDKPTDDASIPANEPPAEQGLSYLSEAQEKARKSMRRK
jgi:hypothetical protein